jgi:pimeloyl-ACP methyl ester carboxylesterase
MTTRREAITATLALTAVAATTGLGQAQSAQKTFLLVHGAWHGGWCWRRVADLLEKRGHKVFTPTLTGLGERSHLLDAKVNLTTHITDIVNVIKWERLSDIVLVGHSYGGMVITGVAEEVEAAIASIVFLDAFVPENGQSLLDMGGAQAIRDAIRAAQERGEIATAPPPATFFHVRKRSRLGGRDVHTTPRRYKDKQDCRDGRARAHQQKDLCARGRKSGAEFRPLPREISLGPRLGDV